MSEYGDRGSGVGDRDRLDTAIDLAVREMLDVEPPSGLRGRVLDRLESPQRGFHWIWIAAPLAGAAIVVLAVMLPSTSDKTPVATVPDQRVAVTPAPPEKPQRPAATQPPVVAARVVARPPRTRLAVAAVAPDEAESDVVWIDALPAPSAMAVAAIEPARGRAMPSIDVAPAEIPALEIRPITDTPRERRNQE